MGYVEAGHNGDLQMFFDWQFHFDARAPFEALVAGGGEVPDEVKQFVPVLTSTKTRKQRRWLPFGGN